MNRQEQTVTELKELYPGITLDQISKLTGLNLTRIHRILKGAPMRLNEWESFTKVIRKKRSAPLDWELEETFLKCLARLTPNSKKKLQTKLQRLEQLTTITDGCF